MTLSRFIALWTHKDYAPERVTEQQLQSIERQLQAQLPADYRNAVLQFGLPRPTIELLDAIVDRELDLRDVSDFLSPEEVLATTNDWRDMGLPEDLVAFATDCMGNLFCFPTNDQPQISAPVFFFDHDSCEVDAVSQSFDKWIEEFCAIAP